MESIAAAHLSFLITFHQADSLSRTVMAISRGEEPRRVREARWAAVFVPSSRSVMLQLILVLDPVAGGGPAAPPPALCSCLTPLSRPGQGHDKLSPKSPLTASDD